MKELWILLDRLGNGGLERVQLTIAKELGKRGLKVKIITGKTYSHFNKEKINVKIEAIAPNNAIQYLLNLSFRFLMAPPSHIMTTSNDVACFIIILKILFFKKTKIIVSQHLAISEPILRSSGIYRIKLIIIKKLMSILYPYANTLIAVSKGVATDLEKSLALRNKIVVTIYNPIIDDNKFKGEPSAVEHYLKEKSDLKKIIYVGRVSKEKRLDVLIQAFAKIAIEFPAILIVVGDGPQLSEIKQITDSHNLSDKCIFTGFIENPFPLIKLSDVLVLPSDYEGFGNVLVEAMSCGTQVISTNCPYGPSEILNNGEFGQLIERGNPEQLAAAIVKVLSGEKIVPTAILSERASEFSVKKAIDKYMELIV